MGRIAIGVFLLLFGIVGLIATKMPDWIVPAVALLAGIAVLGEGLKKP
jgi:hypothetical protein